MKEIVCIAVGVVGGFVASIFGGWDSALVTLVMFMVIDYVSGFVVAGVFHKSKKTGSGFAWNGLNCTQSGPQFNMDEDCRRKPVAGEPKRSQDLLRLVQ